MPNKERNGTSLNEEPVKPSNSKTQEKMHTNSVFDELRLVEELATSSRTSHREKPRSNNKYGMQSMQRIELSKTM